MAPIRRYLRITKYSVLECRIYLDNPALAQTWLLNPRDPVLPKVIDAVRPLVLPKLREEKERERKKSNKKRSIKDVLVQDDFEVSIFLIETSTRHSLLFKHKHFRDKTQTKLVSNSSRLTGESREAPVDVDARDLQIRLDDDDGVPGLLREETDDDAGGGDGVALKDIPELRDGDGQDARRSKRRRRERPIVVDGSDEDPDGNSSAADGDQDYDDDDAGHSPASDQDTAGGDSRPAKRLRDAAAERDDKKKLAMDVSYEGFAIYGRVLCLVVRRREAAGGRIGGGAPSRMIDKTDGQAMMEQWIASTQLPAQLVEEADAS